MKKDKDKPRLIVDIYIENRKEPFITGKVFLCNKSEIQDKIKLIYGYNYYGKIKS